MLTLVAGNTELVLAPGVGGGIVCFRHEGVDVMRPTSREALAAADPLRLACFPLVPYSNRIRRGRFEFDGRTVQLPLNYGDHPHSIHGQGWQSPWSVAEQAGDSATLVYDHAADAWPWTYRAVQRFELEPGTLRLTLSVENRSSERMPAGLGLHPYYGRTPEMRLETSLEGWWETDGEQMPTGYCPAKPSDDWSEWLHGPMTTDNVFSGWSGVATLVWPERALRLTMHSPVAKYMVIYAPVGTPVAVVEPVTHPTDALNQPGLPGIRLLEPGERFALPVRFDVACD